MRRKLLIAIVTITIFAFGAGIVAAKADFNGVWTLDASKSKDLPSGITQTMTVTQNGDRVEIETKTKVGDGEERVSKDAYVLDGKEADFTPAVPAGVAKKSKKVSKWTDDGNGFDATEEVVMNSPNGGETTVRVKRLWRLSTDGKTLIIEIELENPSGTSKSRRVFVKK